jgi:dTDP-4-dehydrorhamnose 3,5-epimerase
MRFEATPLAGLWVLRPEVIDDERGLFARVFCHDAFAAAGIGFQPVQMSVSFNRLAGTLRGLHWQAEPHAETKLVRVTRGRAFDVAVDLRPASPTHRAWFGIELDEHSRAAVLIPPGFAHGFVTLEDGTEMLYAMDTPHAPASARGARWDDPAFGIRWPLAPRIVSERDRVWPAYAAAGAAA